MDVLNMLVNRSIVTIDHAATLQEAARLMRDKQIGSVLVVNDSKIVGIVSDTDLTRRAVAGSLAPNRVAVETIIDEHVVREFIPKLKAAGAEGIIEYPLNKVVY